jgi:hypothetical protein
LLVGVLHNLDDDRLLVLTIETLKEILKLFNSFTSLNLDDGVLFIRIISLLIGINKICSLSVGICPLGLNLYNLRPGWCIIGAQ